MIEFGKTLREAREAKGLSISQLAEQTHMMHQIVEDLEVENFSRIVAAIYGRGFVKLYCEAVGIDPKPLVAEFMDIYSGNRTPAIHVRDAVQTGGTDAEEPAPVQETATVAPRVVQSEFGDPLPETPPVRPALAPSARAVVDPSVPNTTPPEDDLPRREYHPVSGDSYDYRRRPSLLLGLVAAIPTAAWRLLVLAILALGILAALVFGGRALYKAAMTPQSAPESAATAPKTKVTPAKPTQVAAPVTRKPQTIPSLYID